MKAVSLPAPLHHTTVAELGLDYAIVDGVPTVYTDDPSATLAAIAAHDPVPAAREERKAMLSRQCADTIVAGFPSSALGTTHWYDGGMEDQINIMGAASAGVDLPFRCYGIDADGNKISPKTFVLHTAAQLRQVYEDGVAFKLAQLQHLDTLRATLDAATTLADVEAVVW